MPKIIKVNGDNVSIGFENGTFVEVNRAQLNFTPFEGDEVEVYQNENEIIVSRSNSFHTNEKQVNNYNNTTNYNITGAKKVNKWLYILLAFFFGGIGAHKFYAGKTFSGIISILFCWTYIPMFFGFFSAFFTLFKKADENGDIYL